MAAMRLLCVLLMLALSGATWVKGQQDTAGVEVALVQNGTTTPPGFSPQDPTSPTHVTAATTTGLAAAATYPIDALDASGQAANAEVGLGRGPAATPAGRIAPAAITTDLSALAKKATDTATDLANRVVATVDNLDQDIRAVYQGASACLAQVDAVRIRVMTRQLEYNNAIMKTLADAKALPNDLIAQVFQNVAPQLVKDPKPQLWRLNNPLDAVWNNKAAVWSTVDAATLASNLQPTGTVRAFFYVHGWLHDGTKEAAFGDWYGVERGAAFFQPGGVCAGAAGAQCQVYLLAYDTSYPATWDTVIRTGFSTVLGNAVTGNPRDLFLAVVWREYERRARVAGDYLSNMLTPYAGGRSTKNVIISHSLGSYTVAHAAHKLYTARPGDTARFKFWFPMASAMPNTAFSPSTGMFFNAPKLVGGLNAGSNLVLNIGYVRNYHSALDAVLTTAYYFATGVPAMGQIGSSCAKPQCFSIDNDDTTRISRAIHGPAGYFEQVMPMAASVVLSG